MLKIISPTGMPVRGWDTWGSGAFNAPRGGKPHKGADYICTPGRDVIAPCYCHTDREARPYNEGDYSGLLLIDIQEIFLIWLFYLSPLADSLVKGKVFSPGDRLGIAQDISKKYPDIIPHIHCGIELKPEILIPHPTERVFIDPQKLQ